MEKKQKNRKGNVVSFLPTGEYYFKKALTALSRDQYEKALKYLRRASELSPEDPLILMQYGVALLEIEQFEQALDVLLKAHALDPAEQDILYFLAETYAHLGRFIEARNYAKQYIETDVQGEYAEESLEIIDFAEQEDWQLLGDEESQDSEYYYQLEKARRLMEQGNFKDAIERMEELVEEKPDFYSAYNNLALAYFYIGESEQARALLHEVLRRNTGNLHALCNLAVIHYYEKNSELEEILKLLLKIQPYVFEQRYKLGATFALVGKHKEAFKWLRSLQKRGFEGDTGFYFWLSHAAYHSGYEEAARQAWKQLVKMDPDKEGYEPWADQASMPHGDALEHDRDYLTAKLDDEHLSERLFGLFMLGKSSHKQEIISHPKWLDTDKLSVLETYMLGYSLGHQFSSEAALEQAFLRFMKATERLYELKDMVTEERKGLFQLWFAFAVRAFDQGYLFKNPAALAAAAEYLYKSAQQVGVTKKAEAEQYGISVSTLTKYVKELLEFLPESEN